MKKPLTAEQRDLALTLMRSVAKEDAYEGEPKVTMRGRLMGRIVEYMTNNADRVCEEVKSGRA